MKSTVLIRDTYMLAFNIVDRNLTVYLIENEQIYKCIFTLDEGVDQDSLNEYASDINDEEELKKEINGESTTYSLLLHADKFIKTEETLILSRVSEFVDSLNDIKEVNLCITLIEGELKLLKDEINRIGSNIKDINMGSLPDALASPRPFIGSVFQLMILQAQRDTLIRCFKAGVLEFNVLKRLIAKLVDEGVEKRIVYHCVSCKVVSSGNSCIRCKKSHM